MRMWSVAILFLIGFEANAFLLVDSSYRLKSPEKVTVYIASGGCQSNGVSNTELKAAIIRSVDQYWNTVTESRLKMKAGDEVANTLAGGADPGTVIVGCQALGAGASAGTTSPNPYTQSATITLNGTTFVPGNYSADFLVAVLTHELGHALGLNHSGDPASVMTYEAHGWGPAPSYLAQDDKNGVVYLYPKEAVLAGLLGSCSAIATEMRGSQSANPWLYFGELFTLIFAVQLVRFARFLFKKI